MYAVSVGGKLTDKLLLSLTHELLMNHAACTYMLSYPGNNNTNKVTMT